MAWDVPLLGNIEVGLCGDVVGHHSVGNLLVTMGDVRHVFYNLESSGHTLIG